MAGQDAVNEAPRFSIVIPCRNSSGLAVRCLSSIAKQTFPLDRVEVVAVDDASTDGTPYVLERFGEDLPNFLLVRNRESLGCGGARNAGVAASTGQYVVFADSDDWLPEKALEMEDAALSKAGDPDLCHVPYRVDARPDSMLKRGLQRAAASTVQKLPWSNFGPWSKVIRRGLVADFPERVMGEDAVWHFRQCDRISTMCVVAGSEPCYVYDRTVQGAITDTNEWLSREPHFIEQLAIGDVLENAGLKDRWVSDMLRNMAALYDLRHEIAKPWVRKAWEEHFTKLAGGFRAGYFTK